MSLMFCCSFLHFSLSRFDLTLNVMQKVEIPCLPKKKKHTCISPLDRVLGTTPSLEVLVWYPVCTCYGKCYRKVVFETEAQRLFSVERSELYVSYSVRSEGPASGL